MVKFLPCVGVAHGKKKSGELPTHGPFVLICSGLKLKQEQEGLVLKKRQSKSSLKKK
jgi:hypothetical protein